MSHYPTQQDPPPYGHPTQKDLPPPYGMNPPPPQQPQMMIQQPVAVVIAGPQLGPSPARTQCPSCHADITTRVEYEASTKTHIIALILCIVGCWPCCCIPYCVDSCQSANHTCPACGAFIGTYSN